MVISLNAVFRKERNVIAVSQLFEHFNKETLIILVSKMTEAIYIELFDLIIFEPAVLIKKT